MLEEDGVALSAFFGLSETGFLSAEVSVEVDFWLALVLDEDPLDLLSFL